MCITLCMDITNIQRGLLLLTCTGILESTNIILVSDELVTRMPPCRECPSVIIWKDQTGRNVTTNTSAQPFLLSEKQNCAHVVTCLDQQECHCIQPEFQLTVGGKSTHNYVFSLTSQ